MFGGGSRGVGAAHHAPDTGRRAALGPHVGPAESLTRRAGDRRLPDTGVTATGDVQPPTARPATREPNACDVHEMTTEPGHDAGRDASTEEPVTASSTKPDIFEGSRHLPVPCAVRPATAHPERTAASRAGVNAPV